MINTKAMLTDNTQQPYNNANNCTPPLSRYKEARMRIEAEIICQYRILKKDNPDASFHKLAMAVSSNIGVSAFAIKNTLARHGYHNPRPRKNQDAGQESQTA